MSRSPHRNEGATLLIKRDHLYLTSDGLWTNSPALAKRWWPSSDVWAVREICRRIHDSRIVRRFFVRTKKTS